MRRFRAEPGPIVARQNGAARTGPIGENRSGLIERIHYRPYRMNAVRTDGASALDQPPHTGGRIALHFTLDVLI